MKSFLTYLILLIVIAGCGNSGDAPLVSIYPVIDTFEVYNRNIEPEGMELRKLMIVYKILNDSMTEFNAYKDSSIVNMVGFKKTSIAFQPKYRKYFGNDCYTEYGPFKIELSDTIIYVYKVEVDCEEIIDEEGCFLLSPDIGMIGNRSYSWGGGILIDSLYNHPLSKYTHELRDSLLGGYRYLLKSNKLWKLPTSQELDSVKVYSDSIKIR